MIIHHICIQTKCYEDSKEFYCKIMGFQVIKESPGFHSREYNTWLKHDELMIELQTNKSGDQLGEFNKLTTAIVHIGICVDDIEEEYKRITELGHGKFATKNGEDIYEVEGGKLMKVIAPEGTIIEYRDQNEIR